MNAEEIAKEGFYVVKLVIRHRYRQGWRFLTLWKGFGVEEATWEPFSALVRPEGRLNVSAASPICSDFQTFCPDWLHFGHFLCFGGIAASQLSHRIFPIYF